MRRISVLAAVAAFALAGLAQLSVVDQLGRAVVIPQTPSRVVSLYGIATYYLYALGVEDRLALGSFVGLKPGTPSWELLVRIDPGLPGRYSPAVPTLEEALKAEPDLILANPDRNPGADSDFAPFSIPLLYVKMEDLAGMKGAISLLGEVFGAERARALIALLDKRLSRIREELAPLGREQLPRVLFVGSRPLRVASGEMYQSEMIELAGGVSVTSDIRGYWLNVNAEQVLLWDPEVVFIAPYGRVTPETLASDPVWQGVAAVRAGRVYKLPRVLAPWDIPTPESLLGILWMAEKLHPELSLDLEAEARSFYREFFGLELPDELVATIGR